MLCKKALGRRHEYSLCNRPKLVPSSPRIPPHPSCLVYDAHNQRGSHQQTLISARVEGEEKDPLASSQDDRAGRTGLRGGGPHPGFHTCGRCGETEEGGSGGSEGCTGVPRPTPTLDDARSSRPDKHGAGGDLTARFTSLPPRCV